VFSESPLPEARLLAIEETARKRYTSIDQVIVELVEEIRHLRARVTETASSTGVSRAKFTDSEYQWEPA
jgi:ribosome-associated translation inhibitor RaiA